MREPVGSLSHRKQCKIACFGPHSDLWCFNCNHKLINHNEYGCWDDKCDDGCNCETKRKPNE